MPSPPTMSELLSTHDYPSFRDAEDRLRDFLAGRDWPTDVRWIDGENVVASDKALIVARRHLRDPEAVRTEYWQAVPRRLGIRVHALAHDDQRSYCYLWAPSNRLDAEIDVMFDALEIAMADDGARAKLVGRLRYRWYRWRARKRPKSDLLALPDGAIVHGSSWT